MVFLSLVRKLVTFVPRPASDPSPDREAAIRRTRAVGALVERWRAAASAVEMLDLVERAFADGLFEPEAFDRELRLFACDGALRACRLTGGAGPNRAVIALAERFAQGGATGRDLDRMREVLEAGAAATDAPSWLPARAAAAAARYTLEHSALTAARRAADEAAQTAGLVAARDSARSMEMEGDRDEARLIGEVVHREPAIVQRAEDAERAVQADRLRALLPAPGARPARRRAGARRAGTDAADFEFPNVVSFETDPVRRRTRRED